MPQKHSPSLSHQRPSINNCGHLAVVALWLCRRHATQTAKYSYQIHAPLSWYIHRHTIHIFRHPTELRNKRTTGWLTVCLRFSRWKIYVDCATLAARCGLNGDCLWQWVLLFLRNVVARNFNGARRRQNTYGCFWRKYKQPHAVATKHLTLRNREPLGFRPKCRLAVQADRIRGFLIQLEQYCFWIRAFRIEY